MPAMEARQGIARSKPSRYTKSSVGCTKPAYMDAPNQGFVPYNDAPNHTLPPCPYVCA